jgi:AraC-like DNA-binding protein
MKGTRVHLVVFICEGEGKLVLKNTEYKPTPGVLYHCPSGSFMHMTSSRTDPLGWATPAGDSVKSGLPFRSVIPLDKSRFTAVFDHLLAAWEAKSDGYEWQTRLSFQNLLAEISWLESIRYYEEYESVKAIAGVVEYMKRHYADPIRRDELARYASMSVSHFSLLFKKQTGYSPLQYLNVIRIDKARELLRNSKFTVSTIASEVGYQDQLYFTRLFKRETGLSPRDYRKA